MSGGHAGNIRSFLRAVLRRRPTARPLDSVGSIDYAARVLIHTECEDISKDLVSLDGGFLVDPSMVPTYMK